MKAKDSNIRHLHSTMVKFRGNTFYIQWPKITNLHSTMVKFRVRGLVKNQLKMSIYIPLWLNSEDK